MADGIVFDNVTGDVDFIPGSISLDGTTPSTVSALGELSDVTLTSEAVNHFMVHDGSDWKNRLAVLDDINGVVLTSPANGEVLKFNGTNWVNDTDATGGGGGSLDGLSDVTITSAATGDILRYNGSAWVDYADSNFAASGHTHALNDGTDVVLTSPSTGQVLKFNGTNWVNDTDATGGSSLNSYSENGQFLIGQTASGFNSIAFGDDVVASGAYSLAYGNGIVSSGHQSIVLGGENITVSGLRSTSINGNAMIISGDNSIGFGEGNEITGDFNFCAGKGNTPRQDFSYIFGSGVSVIGEGNTKVFAFMCNDGGEYVTIQRGSVAIFGGNTASGQISMGINQKSPDSNLHIGLKSGIADIKLDAGSAPGTTIDKLYNVSGSLYWNGTQLDIAAGAYELNDLSDVNMSGANVGNILRFNGAKWVEYPDSNFSSYSHTHSLNDGTDVVLTSPANGEVLKFNGTNWVNDTDATGGGGGVVLYEEEGTSGATACLFGTTNTFTVSIGTENQTGNNTDYGVVIGRSNVISGDYTTICGGFQNMVSGLYSATLGGTGLTVTSDYSYVFGRGITTGAGIDDRMFIYGVYDTGGNSTVSQEDCIFWAPIGHEMSMGINVSTIDSVFHIGTNSGIADIKIEQGSAPGTTTDKLYNVSGSLFWNGTQLAGGGGGVSAINDLSDVTITSAATGDILRFNGSAWVDYPDSNFAASGHTHSLNDGTDVVLTSPSTGQVLKFNGTNWVNDTDATGGGGGSTALNDLTDATITTPTTGQVLKYNGSIWINDTDDAGNSYSGISDGTTTSVASTSIDTFKLRSSDGTLMITVQDDDGTHGDNADFTLSASLVNISDVDNGMTPSTDDILFYNGSSWSNDKGIFANGRSGGQTIIGGTISAGNLTLSSTSDVTVGYIQFGGTTTAIYDELNSNFIINGSTSTSSGMMGGIHFTNTATLPSSADTGGVSVCADTGVLKMYPGSGDDIHTLAGVLTKTDTGDPTQSIDGMLCINTIDGNLKIYADAAWRTLATW